MITTTGELHAENETRMLSYNVTETQQQTQSVIEGLAARATGAQSEAADLAVWPICNAGSRSAQLTL